MSANDHEITQWARLVDAITCGERPKQPLIRVGSTPKLLQTLGLEPAEIMMATGKIALCRREHPEVSRALWHSLPRLLDKPLAVVPSARRDDSLVVVLLMNVLTEIRCLCRLFPARTAAQISYYRFTAKWVEQSGSAGKLVMQRMKICNITLEKVSPPLCRSRGPQMPSPRHLV